MINPRPVDQLTLDYIAVVLAEYMGEDWDMAEAQAELAIAFDLALNSPESARAHMQIVVLKEAHARAEKAYRGI